MKNYFYLFLLLSLFSCQKDESIPREMLKGKILYYEGYQLSLRDLNIGIIDAVRKSLVYAPRFSHDGSKFACSYDGYVHIIDVASFQTLASISIGRVRPYLAWSPDDEDLAIVSYNTKTIRRVNWKTQRWNTIALPQDYVLTGDIDWSTESNMLAFSATLEENIYDKKICLMGADGTGFKTLTDVVQAYGIRFSPDNKSIAFGNVWDIYKVDMDGNSSMIWKNAYNPCWSKDGSHIMATYITEMGWTDKDTRTEIRLKDLSGRYSDLVVWDWCNLGDWFPE